MLRKCFSSEGVCYRSCVRHWDCTNDHIHGLCLHSLEEKTNRKISSKLKNPLRSPQLCALLELCMGAESCPRVKRLWHLQSKDRFPEAEIWSFNSVTVPWNGTPKTKLKRGRSPVKYTNPATNSPRCANLLKQSPNKQVLKLIRKWKNIKIIPAHNTHPWKQEIKKNVLYKTRGAQLCPQLVVQTASRSQWRFSVQ